MRVQIEAYPYYGTSLDNMDHLNYKTDQKTSKIAVSAAQLAGQMALRLVHDHIIRLDVSRYTLILNKVISRIYERVNQLTQVAFFVLVSGIKSRMYLFSEANVGICWALWSAVWSAERRGFFMVDQSARQFPANC